MVGVLPNFIKQAQDLQTTCIAAGEPQLMTREESQKELKEAWEEDVQKTLEEKRRQNRGMIWLRDRGGRKRKLREKPKFQPIETQKKRKKKAKSPERRIAKISLVKSISNFATVQRVVLNLTSCSVRLVSKSGVTNVLKMSA